MSRVLSRALAEVEAAQRDRDRWARVVVESEQAAENAAAVDVTDPSELDAVGDAAVRAAGKVGAAQRAFATAERRLADARRSALVAEASDEDEQAVAAQKGLAGHRSKLDALLRQLRDLDGVDYEPKLIWTFDNKSVEPPTNSTRMTWTVHVHRTRAAVLRYAVENGRAPSFGHEVGVGFDMGGHNLLGPDLMPETVSAFVAALEVQNAPA